MLEIIVSDDVPPEWSRRAKDRLAELRPEYRDAGAGASAIVADTYGLRLWTFGSGKANNRAVGPWPRQPAHTAKIASSGRAGSRILPLDLSACSFSILTLVLFRERVP
jgi:hypothetical protein